MNPALIVPILLVVLLLIAAALRIAAYRRARRLRGRHVPELDAVLPATLKDADPLLIYFSSPSCGMCRVMEPVIDGMARTTGVLKLDVTRYPKVARAFGVLGTPTTVLVRGGKVEDVWIGVKSAALLRARLAAGVSPGAPKPLD